MTLSMPDAYGLIVTMQNPEVLSTDRCQCPIHNVTDHSVISGNFCGCESDIRITLADHA